MIQVNVNLADDASPMLKRVLSSLTGKGLAAVNSVGGRSAVNAARKYHREYNQGGGWRGARSFGSGASNFGAIIASGWTFAAADADGATISNAAPHFRHKVKGGLIRPKRGNWLTIPLVPEARDRRARDFEVWARQKLFRPRGKNVLAVKDGNGIRGIYALVKQVVQRPWPGALPPDALLADAFTTGARQALADIIEGK